MKNHRFTFVFMLVLAPALLFGAIGCNGLGADLELPETTESLLRYVPDNAVSIASADAEALVELLGSFGPDTPMAAARRMADSMSTRMATAGIDPMRDVRRIMIAGGPGNAFIVLIRADFETEQLKAFMVSEGGAVPASTPETYRMGRDSTTMWLRFASKDLMVVSSAESALSAASARAETGSVSEELRSTLRPIADRPGWMVIRNVPQLIDAAAADLPAEITGLARAVQQISLGGTPSTDALEGVIYLDPAANVEADDLADLIRGLLAGARAQQGLPTPLLEALDTVTVKSTEGRVRLQGRIDIQLLEAMWAMKQPPGTAAM